MLLTEPALGRLASAFPEWVPYLDRLRARSFPTEGKPPVLAFRPPDRQGASRLEPTFFPVVLVLQFLGLEDSGMIRVRVLMGDSRLGHEYLVSAVFAREFTPVLYNPGYNRTEPI